MFKTLSRFVGRTAAIGLMVTGLGLATTVAAGLILIQILGSQPVLNAVSCQLGLSKDCLLQDLRQEKQKLKKLQGRTAELEALYQRLSALDHAASSYSVFYHDEKGWKTVTTGIAFKSLLDPSELSNGWCYIQLGDEAGLRRNLHIAEMDKNGRITTEAFKDNALQKFKVTRSQFKAALSRCQWSKAQIGGRK